jgi:alpha-glucosidase
MHVDEETMNISGMRTDGSTVSDLVVRAFSSTELTTFTVFEDDGVSIDYLDGQVRTTEVSQVLNGNRADVVFGAARGTYQGAPSQRRFQVELVTDGLEATSVSVNGEELPSCSSVEELEGEGACFINAGENLVIARSSPRRVDENVVFGVELTPTPALASVHFVCDDGETETGEAIYVLGNVPELGAWEADGAVRLTPTRYPRWTGMVHGLPPETRIEWKCLRRRIDGSAAGDLEPGSNNVISTPASGFAGTSRGSM